jgi:hypothetical protein
VALRGRWTRRTALAHVAKEVLQAEEPANATKKTRRPVTRSAICRLAVSMDGEAAAHNVQRMIRGADQEAGVPWLEAHYAEEILKECAYSEKEIRHLHNVGAV